MRFVCGTCPTVLAGCKVAVASSRLEGGWRNEIGIAHNARPTTMVDKTECGGALLPASADFRFLFQSICYLLLSIELYIHTHLSYPRVIDRCIHACMYACMYACMFVFKHICMYVCTHVRMYVCMYVCMLVRVYVSMRVSMSINKREKNKRNGSEGNR